MMNNYAVYTLDVFEREVNKLSQEYRSRIQKTILQLKVNPYVGDQLRYKFFREKRIKEKRIYYLIYNDLRAVLVVAISNKKTQQATIDRIVIYFDEYRNYLERLLKS